jgi:hypothetical protein
VGVFVAKLKDLGRPRPFTGLTGLLVCAFALLATSAFAHAIGGKDAAFVAATNHADPFPFLYLGAKHMVTGYDHLLFLTGVIFFLYRLKQIALYVTLFSIGHSLTLLAGVLFGIKANAYIIDAIIGFSVAYKAFDNLGGFRTLFGFQPDTRIATLIFGLFHGFGLATKLQALHLNPNGLIVNLVSFNLGVEIGQIIALSLILVLMTWWRKTPWFKPTAEGANVLIMLAGFVLMGQQLCGYFLGAPA